MTGNTRQADIEGGKHRECLFFSLPGIAEGNAAAPSLSPLKALNLFIRRRLTPEQERRFDNIIIWTMDRYPWLFGKTKPQGNNPKASSKALEDPPLNCGEPSASLNSDESGVSGLSTVESNPNPNPKQNQKQSVSTFKAGDRVRVRSLEEIEATLDHLGKTKGCAFLKAMEQYCGTEQRVLKPVERFVDERDLRVKKCKGIVLLEGVMCPGTTTFGRCDRCCFLFWREEWLEKV